MKYFETVLISVALIALGTLCIGAAFGAIMFVFIFVRMLFGVI